MQDKEVYPTKRIPTIRLCYVAYELFHRYGSSELKLGQTYTVSSPFMLPPGMTIKDACKVVSYLSDKVEKESNLEPACEKSVIMVSDILSNYGFEKVEDKAKRHFHAVTEYDPFYKTNIELSMRGRLDDVVDLFSVGGDFKLFKKSDLHSRYFDWYSKGVTQQEVSNIYKNINREFMSPENTDLKEEKTL